MPPEREYQTLQILHYLQHLFRSMVSVNLESVLELAGSRLFLPRILLKEMEITEM